MKTTRTRDVKGHMEAIQRERYYLNNDTIHDATFIESDPGHGKRKKDDGTMLIDPEISEKSVEQEKQKSDASNKKLKAENNREEKKKDRSEERKNTKTRRSKDSTWAVKNNRSHFGYKLHTTQDGNNDMILNYATTTASLHDSQIDLSIAGIVNYKDMGISVLINVVLIQTW